MGLTGSMHAAPAYTASNRDTGPLNHKHVSQVSVCSCQTGRLPSSSSPSTAFLPRDSMLSAVYATPIPSVCLSVCPPVCLSHARIVSKRLNKRIIKIVSLSDRPFILVFCHQGLLRKSAGFIPNGGAEYKGVAILDQYAAISRKR